MKPSRSLFSTVKSTLNPSPFLVSPLKVPLEPPYSLASLIPPPTPLPKETLLKLHKLAALVPPKEDDTEGWKDLEDLGGLVAIMEGVRSTKVQVQVEGKRVLVDARVREVESEILRREEEETEESRKEVEGEGGRELLKLARVTEGSFFVVRTPEGIRGKIRKGKEKESESESEVE